MRRSLVHLITATTIAIGVSALAVPASAAPVPAAPAPVFAAADTDSTIDEATSTDAEITWAIEPAGAAGPDGRVSIRHEIAPGAHTDEFVTLTNFSLVAADFRIYASDGIVTEEGNFDLLAPGTDPVDGGSWVSFTPVEGTVADDGGLVASLEPGASVTVPVAIEVPDEVTPGDHPAGIVAQYIPDGTSDVQLASRVGVRLHLRVPGDIVGTLTVTDVGSTWHPNWNPFAPGTVTVQFIAENTGNVRLGVDAAVALAGPFEFGAVSAQDSQRELLPGTTMSRTIEMQVWPLVFASGAVSASPAIVGEDDVATSALAGDRVEIAVWTIPWAQLVMLLLIVIALLLMRRQRKRNAAKVRAQIAAAVAAARAQDAADAGTDTPSSDEPAMAEPARVGPRHD